MNPKLTHSQSTVDLFAHAFASPKPVYQNDQPPFNEFAQLAALYEEGLAFTAAPPVSAVERQELPASELSPEQRVQYAIDNLS